MIKDEYLEYLEKQIKDAVAARENYLAFKSASLVATPATTTTIFKVKTESNDQDRKALRSAGRTRDLFEVLYKRPDGETINEVAKISKYSLKEIKQFFYRYNELGLCDRNGEKILLTQNGRNLLEKSQPYTGDNMAVLSTNGGNHGRR